MITLKPHKLIETFTYTCKAINSTFGISLQKNKQRIKPPPVPLKKPIAVKI